MGTVVVFGATSYVGGFVIDELLERGHRVVGVTRRPELARILLSEKNGLTVANSSDAMRLVEGEEVAVINLAFVKNPAPQLVYRQSKALAEAIRRIASGRCRRLVHISTLSVFGDVFDAPPVAQRVRWRTMDNLYAEQKIHAEHLMERLARKLGCEFTIVRLGNVIGPGAPIWVAGLAQRILELRPVGYTGEAGHSNATHVENTAAYLSHLIEHSTNESPGPGVYHHLAEFSSHRWPELLDVISAEVGCAWTTAPRPGRQRAKPRRVRYALKAAYNGPAGAYVRAGWGMLPAWGPLDRMIAGTRDVQMPRLEGSANDTSNADGYLKVFASAHEFRSATIEGWHPPLDFEAACAGIGDWLGTWGYRLAVQARPPSNSA